MKTIDMGNAVEDEGASLTQTLRILSEKTTGSLETTQSESRKYRALLVCSDKSAKQWGTRWLGQSGFYVSMIPDAGRAFEVLRKAKPDIVIVEASARTGTGNRLFEDIQSSPDVDVPLIVLCATTKDVSDAIDADVSDVARKPFDWQLLSRRARKLAGQRQRDAEQDELRQSLKEALEVANRARKKLRHTEAFEPVTGLPNRSKFIDLVGKGMFAAKRDDNCLAVAIVGFSRFKIILEALGRSEANAVFGEIGKRLNACVRAAINSNAGLTGLKTAAVGNLGNGRFAVMLTCNKELTEVNALCSEIHRELAKPAVVSGQTIFLSTATGAAIYPQDSDEPESLVIRAETAMREAKSRGSSCRFYCADREAAASRRLEIEQKLYSALDRRQLRVAYQPINDVMTDGVIGAEALLRWPQADGSRIGPEEFVPIAEDAGLMNRLGAFVIEESCRQLRKWRDAGHEGLAIAINVAKSQLMDPGLPDVIAENLHEHKLQPGFIELEISERGVLAGNDDAIRQLLQLKTLGVRLSIDDFGTGESSIAYLKDMPIDTLKIDRSYIAHLATDGRESRMIAAMIALAQKLELNTIAEGVETAAQLRILQSLACDQYQGFLRSPAVFGDEFRALLDPD